MGAPEMYPDLYAEHLTGDPAHDKAFAALADCPSFAQVEAALKAYARALAEKIRLAYAGDGPSEDNWIVNGFDAADLIDPEVSK